MASILYVVCALRGLHFLQEFRSNIYQVQLGHILYAGLLVKTLKRGGPEHDQAPSGLHCPKSLLGIKPGGEDCLAAPAREVLFFAEILVYVGAETFSKAK
jgi:hypothetical protein